MSSGLAVSSLPIFIFNLLLLPLIDTLSRRLAARLRIGGWATFFVAFCYDLFLDLHIFATLFITHSVTSGSSGGLFFVIV